MNLTKNTLILDIKSILGLWVLLTFFAIGVSAQEEGAGVILRKKLITGSWKSNSKFTGNIRLSFNKDGTASFKCDSCVKKNLFEKFRYRFLNGSVIYFYSTQIDSSFHYIERLDSRQLKLVSYPYDIPETIPLENIVMVDAVIFSKEVTSQK